VKTVEDITERKSAEFVLRAAEEALFEEKERAQVTLNSIGDAVVTTDLLGNVTYLNLVAETMTGWPCETHSAGRFQMCSISSTERHASRYESGTARHQGGQDRGAGPG